MMPWEPTPTGMWSNMACASSSRRPSTSASVCLRMGCTGDQGRPSSAHHTLHHAMLSSSQAPPGANPCGMTRDRLAGVLTAASVSSCKRRRGACVRPAGQMLVHIPGCARLHHQACWRHPRAQHQREPLSAARRSVMHAQAGRASAGQGARTRLVRIRRTPQLMSMPTPPGETTAWGPPCRRRPRCRWRTRTRSGCPAWRSSAACACTLAVSL